jgi:hypothetical protein
MADEFDGEAREIILKGAGDYRTDVAAALRAKGLRIAELEEWVYDLQEGMSINCVYCGHRYGPDDEHAATVVEEGATPTMQDALRAHISDCPKHPMSEQRDRITTLEQALRASSEGFHVLADHPGQWKYCHILRCQTDQSLLGEGEGSVCPECNQPPPRVCFRGDRCPYRGEG